MDFFLLGVSFLAGLLTILAPCVLPLLPVIVGGAAGSKNKWQPIIMTSSLALSVIVFTLLLKASTLLIDIPQKAWSIVSGGIVLGFGIFMLFPILWEKISIMLNLQSRSTKGLSAARQTDSTLSGVLMGAALGPVFSSCSPTYFVILATVLPVSFALGIIYLLAYGLGLAIMLGAIAFFGQRLTLHLGWAADSNGWFKRGLGALLILVGLAVVTGIDKKIEIAILDAGFGVTTLEQRLLDDMGAPEEARENPLMEDSANGSDKTISDPRFNANYKAPELAGLENWLNSDPIASMEELRGKVVLVDFWTYSCINCIRTLPYLQSWHEKYADDGLVILGIHAPEFQFEQKIANVEKATRDFGLTYPVVQDNDFTTWRAYKNRYWPAKYLVDKNGVVRYTHFGEGAYAETEELIVKLLNAKMEVSEVDAETVNYRGIGTPETYIGLSRRKSYVSPENILKKNQWTLVGEWEADDEKAVSQSAGASIKMNFTANKANLVMNGSGAVEVFVDGKPIPDELAGKDVEGGILTFDDYRLYELTDFGGEYGTHEIELRFSQPGAELFAWTFG